MQNALMHPLLESHHVAISQQLKINRSVYSTMATYFHEQYYLQLQD